MKVSVIMSFEFRPSLENTLYSWSTVNWPKEDIEFILCDNGSEDTTNLAGIIATTKLNITKYVRKNEPAPLNRVWNELYKLTSGEFIIIAMQDEIISNRDIIQCMLNTYKDGERVSLITYELSYDMTNLLPSIDWKNNPKLIETLPGFWTDTFGTEKNGDKLAAGLLMHITGQYRKDWDYLGMFHNELGYLLVDRDIVLREKVLGKQVQTPKDVVCYHQWHRRKVGQKFVEGPSFIYFTERQARLLDEPEREVR